MKKVPGISFVEYEYAATRTARAAWDERSILEASADGSKAYYNAALQHASEVIYELYGEEAAKAIQGLRK